MDELRMTVVEHLTELRRRLIIAGLALFAAAAVAYAYVGHIRGFFTQPAGNIKLIYLSPTEALMTDIKLALLAGLFLALPVILYQAWAFVAPALRPQEKTRVWPLVVSSSLLFVLGGLFAYYLVLPLAIRFVLGFATPDLQALFSYSRYVSFVTGIILSFGFIFQMPLGILFLARMGLVTARGLRRKRKFAVLAIFVVAAVLTPPDVLSQVLMAAPMLVLYEVSVWLAHAFGPRARREAAD